MRIINFFSAACLATFSSAITVDITGGDAPSPANGQDEETFGQTDTESTVLASVVQFPPDDCCWFYSNESYLPIYGSKEHCLKEDAGKWYQPKVSAFSNASYIYSYRCGKNVKLNLCENTDPNKCNKMTGRGNHISSSAGEMSVSKLGKKLNSGLRNWMIEKYDEKAQGATTLFRGDYCKEYSASFEFAPQKNQKTADYGVKDLNDRGVLSSGSSNKIKSIMVPFGYIVTLFEQESQRGVKRVEYGPATPNSPMRCVTLTDDPKYKGTKSFQISERPADSTPPMLIGDWELLSQNRFSFEFELTSGTAKSKTTMNSESSTKTNSLALSSTLRVIPQTEITMQYTHGSESATVQEASQTAAKNTEVTILGECDDIGHGASLYQWTVASPDRSVKVRGVGICRNNEDHENKPSCLPHDCDFSDESQCNKCVDRGLAQAEDTAPPVENVNPKVIDDQPKITKAVTK